MPPQSNTIPLKDIAQNRDLALRIPERKTVVLTSAALVYRIAVFIFITHFRRMGLLVTGLVIS